MPAPTVVTFPNIAYTHAMATYELIRPYFNGASHTLGGIPILFPTILDLSFAQDLRALETISAVTIGLFTASISNQTEHHVKDPLNVKAYGWEVRADVRRELVLVVPNADGSPGQGDMYAAKIYDMIFAIISTQRAAFAARNIYNPMLDILPVQVSVEKTLSMYSGAFESEVRASYTKDA